jgi:3-deoxy-D-manno-octulosonate 8-phosphate phosphatase (KDO 8-P phosphatase)
LIDLSIMSRVGLAVAVDDANAAVKQRADWCTRLPGGQGAVREVCDLIMQAQGHFEGLVAAYLK